MKQLTSSTQRNIHRSGRLFRVVKIYCLLSVLFVGSLTAASSYAQTTRLTIKANTTLSDVVKQIEKNSEFTVFLNNNQVNTRSKVSVDVTNGTIDDVMKQALAHTDLTYQVIDKQIVVKQTAAPQGPQQSRTIHGKVLDDLNEPVIGANVSIKGTTKGVITDIDGNFTLTDVLPSQTVVVSYVGYTAQEKPVGSSSAFTFKLTQSNVQLQEVVVAALGLKKEKKSLAYSVSDVNSDQLNSVGNANPLKGMEGKISGVNFTSTSSDPTSSVMVNIRGETSMNLGDPTKIQSKNQPLYVLDGIPVGQQGVTNKNEVDYGNIISQLNPDDIESITVLKGASAGALYGSSAGNGVIMITTKSGAGAKKGIGVSFNTSVTFDKPYMIYESQQLYTTGNRINAFNQATNFGYGPKADGSSSARYFNPETQQWTTAPLVSANENRIAAFLQTGNTQNYNLDVTGNDDKGNFRLALGYMDNTSVVPESQTNRFSASANAKRKLNNWFTASFVGNYTRTYSPNKTPIMGRTNDSVLDGVYATISPSAPPLNNWMRNTWLRGYEGRLQNTFAYATIDENNPFENYTRTKYDNPYFVAKEVTRTFSRDNFFGKAQLDFQITKEISLMARTGLDFATENYELRRPWGMQNYQFGSYETSINDNLSIQNDIIATYNKTFNDWFGLNASAGYNYSYSTNNYQTGTAGQLERPGEFSLANAKSGQLSASSSYGVGQTQSIYATASLSFLNQLFLDLSARNDWGGILEEDKNHHLYPSVSLSWLANEAISMPEFFNLVKLRGGIAQVGHGIGRPRNITSFSFRSPDYDWNSAKLTNLTNYLVDPNIKSEISTTMEAGFDLWMWDKRIMIDFSWFKKIHANQQGNIDIPRASGFTSMLTNVGTVESNGVEGGITVVPVKNKNWYWDVNVNATHFASKITELSEAVVPNGYIFQNYNGPQAKYAVGERIGNMYENKTVMRRESGRYAGMPIIGNDGKYKQSTNQFDYIGNYNPDVILGLNTSIRYKGFTFTASGSFRIGGTYNSKTEQFQRQSGRSLESVGTKFKDPIYWAGGRDAETGGFPWPVYSNDDRSNPDLRTAILQNEKNYNASIQDASYAKGVYLKPGGDENNDADWILQGADPKSTLYNIPSDLRGIAGDFVNTHSYSATNFKLKELTFGYTFPNKWTQKAYIHNLNLAFVARNVFQWNANGRNEDPESAFEYPDRGQGNLWNPLPSIRSLGFKLSLDF